MSVRLRVSVAYAAPGLQVLVDVVVPAGANLGEAVDESGLVARLRLEPSTLSFAIFGERAQRDSPLADGDRIELLRPLFADAKAVRRQRAAKHPLASQREGRRSGGSTR